MPATPELKSILDEVEAELSAMILAGEVGTLTVHVGRGDLCVEAVCRRKHDPVLLRKQQERRLAVIRKAR